MRRRRRTPANHLEALTLLLRKDGVEGAKVRDLESNAEFDVARD